MNNTYLQKKINYAILNKFIFFDKFFMPSINHKMIFKNNNFHENILGQVLMLFSKMNNIKFINGKIKQNFNEIIFQIIGKISLVSLAFFLNFLKRKSKLININFLNINNKPFIEFEGCYVEEFLYFTSNFYIALSLIDTNLKYIKNSKVICSYFTYII